MSRIAFLSCVRIPYKGPYESHDPPCKLDTSEFEQPVWDYLLQQDIKENFDAVLFLGDQVYSDYGWTNKGGDRPVRKNWSPDLFHRLMYSMYKAQFTQVASFKRFMQRMHDKRVPIGMTWDDHDFGYNNGCGNDPRFANKFESAKVLFEQFRDTCIAMPSDYPPIPAIPTVTNPRTGIERIQNPIRLGNKVEVVMLDSRTYRDVQLGGGASLIGPQWGPLQTAMTAVKEDQLMIVCMGSTYSVAGKLPFRSSDQSWMQPKTDSPYAHFGDFTTLSMEKHIIYLTGDIHKNDLIPHINKTKPKEGFCEVISSGAHMPLRVFENFGEGPNQARFGILDITDDHVDVRFFADNQIETKISKTISRATGLPIP